MYFSNSVEFDTWHTYAEADWAALIGADEKAESNADSCSGISFLCPSAVRPEIYNKQTDPRPAAEPEVEHLQWHILNYNK